MNPYGNKYDAAVVGGGLAGLTAAVFLARAGKSVIVLEKAGRTGGLAQTVNKNGALFNFGPHAMYEGGAALRILEELGCRPKTGYTAAGRMLGILEGEIMQIPQHFSPEENAEWTRLTGGLRQIDTASLRGISLQEWVETNLRHERVRLLFSAMCRQAAFCGDLHLLSAGYAIRQSQLASQGVKYVEGGWQTVADKLRELAVQAGAVIATGRKTEQIAVGSGKVRSIVLSDGTPVEVSAVIAAVGPDEACRMVEGSEHMSLGSWKAQSRPIYAACLDVALRCVPRPEHLFAVGMDQPLYYSNHSASVTLSDNGSYVLHLMKYKNTRSEAELGADKKQLTGLLDLLQPGWEGEMVASRYLPGLLVAHDARTIHHNGEGPAASPAVPEVRGLFVAGDWVGRDDRLADAAMSSARLAAQQTLSGMNAAM